MSYNGMPCQGECSKKSPEEQHKLNNFYEYNFEKKVYVCKECGHEKQKRYYVDFYDAFDGWGGTFGFYSDRLFDDLEEAKKCCLELQSKLAEGNKKMGEHYGVIDGKTKFEVFCTMNQ